MRCVQEDSHDEAIQVITANNRSASILTQPSEIPTSLAHSSCRFQGPQFSGDNLDIEAATLLALRNGCSFRELIEHHPDDVVTVLRDSVVKLGSFKAKDSDVLNAFGPHKMMTRSRDELEDPYWEEHWKNTIQERSKHSLNVHQVGWEEMVPVSCYVVQIKDIAKTEDADIIALLLKKTSSGAAPSNVWDFPAVRAVIDYHWQHWARRILFISFIVLLIWSLSFAAYVLVYLKAQFFCTVKDDRDSPYPVCPSNMTLSATADGANNFANEALANSLRRRIATPSHVQAPPSFILNSTARDYGAFSEDRSLTILTYLFNLLSFVFMLPFGVEEYWTLFAQRRDWISWKNTLDMAAIGVQTAIFLCHVFNHSLRSEAFACLLALQIVLVSIRLLRFVSLLGEGTTFLGTALYVIYAVRYWIAYIIFSGVVSSLCLGALYKPDHNFHTRHRELHSVLSSLVTTFQIIFGSFDTDYIFDADYAWVKFLFFFGFQLLMAVTVLNLIIAAMSECYHSVSKNRLSQLYRGRALVIDEMNDLRLPQWLVPELKSYIQFITVEKEALENRSNPLAESTTESQAHCIKELQDDVRKLTARLDGMTELLGAFPPTSGNRRHH